MCRKWPIVKFDTIIFIINFSFCHKYGGKKSAEILTFRLCSFFVFRFLTLSFCLALNIKYTSQNFLLRAVFFKLKSYPFSPTPFDDVGSAPSADTFA